MKPILTFVGGTVLMAVCYLGGSYNGYEAAVKEVVKAYMNQADILQHSPPRTGHGIDRIEDTLVYQKGALSGIQDLVTNPSLSPRFRSNFQETHADLVFRPLRQAVYEFNNKQSE